MRLFFSRHQAEGLLNAVFQLVLNHFSHKDNDYLRFTIYDLRFFIGGSKFFTLHSSLFTFILYLCTQMQQSDKVINIILALVALGLLALCCVSVMS